jgi:hypothetical protein
MEVDDIEDRGYRKDERDLLAASDYLGQGAWAFAESESVQCLGAPCPHGPRGPLAAVPAITDALTAT